MVTSASCMFIPWACSVGKDSLSCILLLCALFSIVDSSKILFLISIDTQILKLLSYYNVSINGKKWGKEKINDIFKVLKLLFTLLARVKTVLYYTEGEEMCLVLTVPSPPLYRK